MAKHQRGRRRGRGNASRRSLAKARRMVRTSIDWRSLRPNQRVIDKGTHFEVSGRLVTWSGNDATEAQQFLSKRARAQARTIKIPKTQKGRSRGFSKLTRVQSKKQAVYGHAITFSPSYQKAHREIVNVQQGQVTSTMPMFQAERLFLRQAWAITPRKTAPHKL